jgi:hypothetical protein
LTVMKMTTWTSASVARYVARLRTKLACITDLTKKTTKPPPKKKAKKASKPKKPKEQLPFRFLDLPPELRDMIYEMALVDPNGVSIVARTRGHRQIPMRGTVFEQGDYHYHRGRQHSIKPGSKAISPISTIFRPALLAVNKKINAEAVNYLYGHTFTFENCTALADFLAAIGPRNQQRLNTVKIVSWGSFSTSSKASSRAHNRSGLTMLAGATNLKALILACSISGSGATQKAQYLFREAHYFIAAYGAANGSKDAAVDIIKTNDFPVFIHTPSGRVCPTKEEQRDTFQKMLRVLAKTL